VFTMGLSSGGAINLLSKGGIPVTALDFTRQDDKGDPLTALVTQGEVTYPDYPKMEKVLFRPPDFVGLGFLEKFRIETVVLDPEHQAIRLRLQGVAGRVKVGPPGFSKDYRLTCFETLRQNPQLMILFGIIVWVFPTTVGSYKLYQDVKGSRS
jgi:hypothetical protein